MEASCDALACFAARSLRLRCYVAGFFVRRLRTAVERLALLSAVSAVVGVLEPALLAAGRYGSHG